MKAPSLLVIASASALLFSSCGPGVYASQNSAGGALLGAAAGAVIGHQSGNAFEGAVLGGAVGGLAGEALTPRNYAPGYGPASGPDGYHDYDGSYREAPVVYRNSYHYQVGYQPFLGGPGYDPYLRHHGFGCAPVYRRCGW